MYIVVNWFSSIYSRNLSSLTATQMMVMPRAQSSGGNVRGPGGWGGGGGGLVGFQDMWGFRFGKVELMLAREEV